MTNSYTLYHLHSDYSLLDSCSKFEEYIELAVKNGQTALASTEHGKPLGWVSKKMACDKAGIKFIHGVEIYLTENLEPKIRDNYHTVLLAKNYDGVLELNRIVSISCNPQHTYYTNRISFDEFLALSPNIIKISACLASPLCKLSDEHPRYKELASGYDYFEVQPHHHDEQIQYNRRLVKLSKELNKPIIAGTDTHSSSPYKAECRKMLMKRKKQSYGDEDRFDLTYKTYNELYDLFRTQGALSEEEISEAIGNTNVMNQSVEDFILDTTIKYPILYGSQEKDSQVLGEKVEQMFREKLDSGVIPRHQEEAFRSAIQEEMRVFRKIGMDGFMLSMSELLCYCREAGIPTGPARGSVGGSRVAYITDITDLNPETWQTVFSRFCNEDRTEIGDIDIDVIEADRPAIFKYIVDRFGADKTSRVASFGTMAELKFIEDAGGALRKYWDEDYPDRERDNPYSIPNIKKIKAEYHSDAEKAKKKYAELFYYFDGMVGTKISQSVHPAGMVISPLNLNESYGVFQKDDDLCLFIDMEELHEVGAAKYDFLILKTVQVINDACRTIGIPYPKSHEINWNDEAVWIDMMKSPVGIFQMEGKFAFDSLKKFGAKSIFDMSLVTAAIRPSGASYRDALLSRTPNHNPSALIDNLLSDNNGYLVYQCDVIKFLQQVCGLSGSEADNVRRAIGRKDADRLQKALPGILEGYCQKSDKPREVAEKEATEFLKIIEDASSYMFGLNHSIAYCLLGYLCAYFRYYHPIDFITSYLNNAANEEDITSGTKLAKLYGIKVTTPKFGVSRSDYFFVREENIIAKGLSSVKHMGRKAVNELFTLSKGRKYHTFSDLLYDITTKTSLNARQIDILIKIDFFSEFGNQRELLLVYGNFDRFTSNQSEDHLAKQIKRSAVDGTEIEPIVRKYSTWKTKAGKEAKSYTLLDTMAIIREYEMQIKELLLPDLDDLAKSKNFSDLMGYMGYTTGRDEDRRKLFVKEVYALKRKRDGAQFGYGIITQSIGSGKESRFTVFNRLYDNEPIKKGDIILCKSYTTDGPYFTLTSYDQIVQ